MIGWFLNNAATNSYQDLLVRTMLEGTRVRQIMTLDPETVPAHLSLQELMDEYFYNRSYQSFPVIEDGHPIGLVTLNQVKQVPRDQWSQRNVKEIMTPIEKGITVASGEDLTKVLEKMQETHSRRLLVTSNGNLEGILSATDVANWLQRQQEFGETIPERKTFPQQEVSQLKSSQT